MKNFIFFIYLIVSSHAFSFAQLIQGQIDPLKVNVPQKHFLPEYTFDISSDHSAWLKQKPGLNVSFATTNELYLRSEVPVLENETNVWEEVGWRGERLNKQILIWAADSIHQIHLDLNDLKDINGNVINKDNLRIKLIRYVLSNFPVGATNSSCDISDVNDIFLMPDRFESFDRFDLPANSLRPLWISIDIPLETKPGNYSGAIEVRSGTQSKVLQLRIKVQNQVLPEPKYWKFRLDLWQNPWVIAWFYQVEPWSDEHKILLKKHLKLYADAGGKYITTYAVHSPWSDNSNVIEGGMIEWIKNENDSWDFDFRIFDQYVELAIDAGIETAITIHTPLPLGNRFRYLDKSIDQYVYEYWLPSSQQFQSAWNYFLDELKDHLKKKGWFEKAYIALNESLLEDALQVAKFIKNNYSGWKVAYAGNWYPELNPIIDDYSCILNSEPDSLTLVERKDKGFTTTFYVCCTPPRPNNFVFSFPIEGQFLGWYSAARNYDGFLRWAYDAWTVDPNRDARHTFWPAGDCFLVYPGTNSSIRFEKLREGISDYEKIRIIRDQCAKSSRPKIKEMMQKLENHLSYFNDRSEPKLLSYDIQEIKWFVDKGKKMIEQLANELTK
jgi:hypothetical protein